jgi:pimeloyl-ACP methyl ester carboxylesterase
MNTFVLLHGAWHGPWCWKKLIPLIESKGGKVIAPEIDWNNNNSVSLNDETTPAYIEDICKQIRMIGKPAVLVGHSMGGVVISQIAEVIPEHILLLVYISGFLLANDQCVNDTETLMTGSLIQPRLKLSKDKKNILVPTSILREGFYSDCSDDDYHFALSNICPQPVASFITPIKISQERFGKVPRIYIECLQDKAIPISAQKKMQRDFECNHVHTLESSHTPFFSKTTALYEILLNLAT